MVNTENAVFKNIADQSDDIFFVYDLHDSRFIYVNAAFTEITKRNLEDVYNDPVALLDMIHQDDLNEVKYNFKLIIQKKYKTWLEFRIIRADQTERWIRLKISPVLNGTTIVALSGIAEDDTARKAGLFNIQKINIWKNSILNIVSHELRGPIGIVKMLATEVKGQLAEKEHKNVHELIDAIEDISKRNLKLIRELLKNEHLDTAAVELNLERVDLVWETKEVLRLFMISQKNLKKTFVFTYSPESIFARVDNLKFGQIINNLVSNSLKFTHDDGNIAIHLEKLETSVLVTVTDNGIGIPKHLQPILFNKFTKAGRTSVEGEESTGLGMWIIKTHTEEHGGRVWFESEENKGSKFYVEIPLGITGD